MSIWPRLLNLIVLCAANAPACQAAAAHQIATVVSLEKPSAAALDTFLTKRSAATFNHPFAGCTSLINDMEEPKGWTVLEFGAVVGHGKDCYTRVSNSMQQWRVMDAVEWAGMHHQKSTGMLATFARLSIGFGWCINPCKQVYWDKNVLLKVGDDAASNTIRGGGGGSKRMISQMAYATLNGHLIEGEERFLVEWDGKEAGHRVTAGTKSSATKAGGMPPADGEVRFYVRSVSRGSGAFGSIIFPFIRPMQQRFFRDQVESMKARCDMFALS